MMTKTLPKFLTAYGERKKTITPSGKEIENTYGYKINKAGQKVLAITGTTNVYEKIQENLEETKIENILARAAAGDNTVFRPEGIYGDMTTAPSNLIEAREMMQELENTWNSLPNEIKNKYDNDVEVFIGASGSKTWLEDMGLLKTSDESTQKVTENKATEKGEAKDES